MDRFAAAKDAVTSLYALAYTCGQWAKDDSVGQTARKNLSDQAFTHRDALTRVISEAMDVAGGADLTVSDHGDWREMAERCTRLRDALEAAEIDTDKDAGDVISAPPVDPKRDKPCVVCNHPTPDPFTTWQYVDGQRAHLNCVREDDRA